ncbi:hypothetical protein JXL19_01180, partial [bacterium]|nr:hypothetical protein [bacterium]
MSYIRKRFVTLFFKGIFWSAFFFVLLCFSSSLMAGAPINGDVYIYNVGNASFSVVWEVDAPSIDCGVEVYRDNSGSPLELTGYTIHPWQNSTNPGIAMSRGLMQVDVTDIVYDPIDQVHTFYIRTFS